MTSIIIIGGGPAGIAAAIQLSRYGFLPLLFEGNQLGGLLRNANWVENYPGFPGGISGMELVARIRSQFESHQVKVRKEEVVCVSPPEPGENELFTVTTDNGHYDADVVIAAGGTSAQTIPLVTELSEGLRKYIFSEVYPLLGKKDKRIAIIGAGDAAFDYALNLAQSNDVIVLNRSDKSKALPLLVNRVFEHDRIEYRENTRVVEVSAGNEKKLALTFVGEVEIKKIELDYLLVAVGRQPRRDYFSQELLAQEEELLDQGLLHVIGDLKNGRYRQVALAVGNGIEAAMKIYEKFGVSL